MARGRGDPVYENKRQSGSILFCAPLARQISRSAIGDTEAGQQDLRRKLASEPNTKKFVAFLAALERQFEVASLFEGRHVELDDVPRSSGQVDGLDRGLYIVDINEQDGWTGATRPVSDGRDGE